MGANQVNFGMPELTSQHGCEGKISSPIIAKIAQHSLVFDNFYSGYQSCSPSRAAIMTGRLPVRQGIGIPGRYYDTEAFDFDIRGSGAVFSTHSVGGLPKNETSTPEALKVRECHRTINKVTQRTAFIARGLQTNLLILNPTCAISPRHHPSLGPGIRFLGTSLS